jgi:hypothetical protein
MWNSLSAFWKYESCSIVRSNQPLIEIVVAVWRTAQLTLHQIDVGRKGDDVAPSVKLRSHGRATAPASAARK